MKMKMNKSICERLPVLKKYMDEEKVMCFGDGFEVSELTEEYKEKVKEVEDAYKQCKSKVIAVIDQLALLPGDETQMQCYIYIDGASKPWEIDGRTTGFMARVVNKGWDVEEDGSIGVEEIDGWLKRCM